MSLKKIFANTRGEIASLILVISMVVATLGIIGGSRLVEERIKTSTRAAVSPTPLLAQLVDSCDTQCKTIGADFGSCSGSNSCSTGSSHPTYSCKPGVYACCCGYNAPPPTNTPSCSTPTAPVLSDPANGATLPAASYTLKWSDTATTGNVKYHVYVRDPVSTSDIVANTIVDRVAGQNSYSYTVDFSGRAGKRYDVSIRGINSCNNMLMSTQTIINVAAALATNTPAPPATNTPAACTPPTGTTITAPSSNGSLPAGAYTVKWTDAANTGNVKYHVIVKPASGTYPNSDIVADVYVPHVNNQTSYTYAINFSGKEGKTYHINVQGVNSCGNAADNGARIMTITAPPATNTPIPPPATATPGTGTGKPDLQIPALNVSYAGPNAPIVTLSIKNAGSVPVSYNANTILHQIKAQIFDGTTPVCTSLNTADIPNLGAGATLSHPISLPVEVQPDCPTFTPVTGKTYKVTFTLDSTNVIPESNEGNNANSINVTYGGAPPATNTPTKTPTKTPTSQPPATATPGTTVKRPDLIVKSSTHSFNASNELIIVAGIQNIGTADVNFVAAPKLNIEIKDPNTNPTTVLCENAVSVSLAGLKPQAIMNHTTNVTKELYTLCPSFTPTPGKIYKVTLYVDPPSGTNGVVTELVETNNSRSFNFTQPSSGNPPATNTPTNTPTATPSTGTGKPDLQIPTLNVSYSGPNTPIVTLTIKNAGPVPVSYNANTTLHQIKAQIFDGATPVCTSLNTADIPNLGAGATLSHPISLPVEVQPDCPTFTPVTGKTYTVTFTLDDTNVIAETNETNNSQSINVTYGGGTPPAIATPTTPSTTTVDVLMNVTIINPQANFTIWGTAQELTGSLNVTPTPVKCNTGDSTQVQTTVKCPQLKRGKNYEFVALAKQGVPNAQMIESAKNSYIIPGSSNVTPQVQNKTLTLPPSTTTTPTSCQPATAPAITAPSADGNLTAGPYTIKWTDTAATPNIKYHLTVFPVGGNYVNSEIVADTFITHVPNQNAYTYDVSFAGKTGKQYEIRVVGINACSNSTDSGPRTISVGTLATLTPVNVAQLPTCVDLLVTGDSMQKNDVIFLPNGYTDYATFESDAKEVMSHYRAAVPDSGIQGKYNFKLHSAIGTGYDVATCTSANSNLKYPCWNANRAKAAMRNCNGDEYIVLAYTAKPEEDSAKAAQALANYGGTKGVTLGKENGEYLVLRYDLSYIRGLITGSISDGGGISAAVVQFFQNILQRFR